MEALLHFKERCFRFLKRFCLSL